MLYEEKIIETIPAGPLGLATGETAGVEAAATRHPGMLHAVQQRVVAPACPHVDVMTGLGRNRNAAQKQTYI